MPRSTMRMAYFLNGTKEEVAQVRNAIYLLGLLNPLVNVPLYNITGPYPASEAEMTTWVWSQIINYAILWTTTTYQNNGFASALLPFCNHLEHYNPAASGVLPDTSKTDIADLARFVSGSTTATMQHQPMLGLHLLTTHQQPSTPCSQPRIPKCSMITPHTPNPRPKSKRTSYHGPGSFARNSAISKAPTSRTRIT